MVTWRVLTWNLQGSKPTNLEVAAAVIGAFMPDVVALQEVQRRQARALAQQLGWQHTWARKHYPWTPLLWWRAEGLAILTPGDLSAVTRTSLSPGASTWTYRHRVLLAATVRRGADELRLYDLHLSSHDADQRISQARRVAARVTADAAATAVVAGDLNAVDEVEVLRELRAVGLRDPGGDVTSPSVAPRRRLDYVLVPSAATVTDELTPEGGPHWHTISDHLPTLVELQVRCARSSGAAPSRSPTG